MQRKKEIKKEELCQLTLTEENKGNRGFGDLGGGEAQATCDDGGAAGR